MVQMKYAYLIEMDGHLSQIVSGNTTPHYVKVFGFEVYKINKVNGNFDVSPLSLNCQYSVCNNFVTTQIPSFNVMLMMHVFCCKWDGYNIFVIFMWSLSLIDIYKYFTWDFNTNQTTVWWVIFWRKENSLRVLWQMHEHIKHLSNHWITLNMTIKMLQK